MIGAIALLLLLGAVFSLLIRGRVHPWNMRLANMNIRSARGPNLTTILAVAGLATLLLKAAQLPFVASRPTLALWLVAGTVALVIGYIIVGDITKLVVGGLGVVLLIFTEGVAGVIQIAILALLILWLLGALRGWMG